MVYGCKSGRYPHQGDKYPHKQGNQTPYDNKYGQESHEKNLPSVTPGHVPTYPECIHHIHLPVDHEVGYKSEPAGEYDTGNDQHHDPLEGVGIRMGVGSPHEHVGKNEQQHQHPGHSIVRYEWDFGDGNGSTAQSPSHSYAAGGTFTVSLTVTDDGGLTDQANSSATIVAQPQDPIADPNGPYNGFEGIALQFDGSGSSDPDGGNITAYDWDFGDGNTGTGVSPTNTYAAAGTYTVTLTVTNAGGSDSVGELVEATGSTQPNVSKHLTTLLSHRLVKREKRGNSAYYTVADPAVFKLCEIVCGNIERALDEELRAFSG